MPNIIFIYVLYDYFRQRSGKWNPPILLVCQLWNKMANNFNNYSLVIDIVYVCC